MLNLGMNISPQQSNIVWTKSVWILCSRCSLAGIVDHIWNGEIFQCFFLLRIHKLYTMYVPSPSSLKCKYTNKQKVYFGIMRWLFFFYFCLLSPHTMTMMLLLLFIRNSNVCMCVYVCIVYDRKLVSWWSVQ